MPDLALANWMWLGRMFPGYKDLSLGMRMLLGRGRPVMRKVYLGRGPRDEVHQGLQGNSMIVAQPSARFSEVMPNVHHCSSSLVLLFCKSVDDVKNSHALVVERARYKECMQRRIQVCPTFADVELSDIAINQDLPANGVPQAFVDSAISMPEMAIMRTTMDGPVAFLKQICLT